MFVFLYADDGEEGRKDLPVHHLLQQRQAVSQQPTSLLVSSGHYGSSACSTLNVRYVRSGSKFAVRFSTYNGFISSQFVKALVQWCSRDLKLACALASTLR